MPFRPSLAAAAALLSFTLGCASGPRPVAAIPGVSDDWKVLETRHFRIRTNVPDGDAVKLAARLERMRSAVSAGLGISPTVPGRHEVIAVASDRDWTQYFDRHLFAVTTELLGTRLIAINATSGFNSRKPPYAVHHALARELMGHAYPHTARWFAVGMACYLEPLSLEAGGTSATLGWRNDGRTYFLRGKRVHALSELWAWDGRQELSRLEEAHLYASSYLWAAMLMTHAQPQLKDFMRRLSQGEEPRPAWDAAFGALTAGLEEEMERFRRTGKLTPVKVEFPAPNLEYTRRPLTRAEAAVTRAELELTGDQKDGRDREEAQREMLGKALAADPTHVRANVLLGQLEHDPAKRLAMIQRAVAANPRDPNGHLWLARRLAQSGGAPEARRAALAEAVTLAPDFPDALNELAWFELQSDRAHLALPLAKRAAELAPNHPSYLDTYAGVLFALNDCRAALEAQTRATELLPDQADAETRAQYYKALDSYLIVCGKPEDKAGERR